MINLVMLLGIFAVGLVGVSEIAISLNYRYTPNVCFENFQPFDLGKEQI